MSETWRPPVVVIGIQPVGASLYGQGTECLLTQCS